MVKALPKALTKHFQVMILVDTVFWTVYFLHDIRKLKYHVIAKVRCDRQLTGCKCDRIRYSSISIIQQPIRC
ncbi:hypothetical protein [Tolypothrix sp. NIES-4075]|uniref:hypothetical protein n=1 Tax=Tolypothrix sp. NIES-4075 TaxID=2005459 RepID=UPI001180BFC2|nr:hypothetical protein [Tolypothrix sp. NIES-4075]